MKWSVAEVTKQTLFWVQYLWGEAKYFALSKSVEKPNVINSKVTLNFYTYIRLRSTCAEKNIKKKKKTLPVMQLTFPTVSVVSSALFPRTLSQKVFSLVKIQNPTPLPFVIFMAINLKLGFISKKANVTFTHLYRQICWCCSTTVLLRWTFLAAPIARLLTQNNAVVSSLSSLCSYWASLHSANWATITKQ